MRNDVEFVAGLCFERRGRTQKTGNGVVGFGLDYNQVTFKYTVDKYIMALFRALLVFLKKLGVNKKDVNQK
jgi:hypothetical protein